MKRKFLLSAFLVAATWSLSSLATADWDTGPCPGGGTAPCIEAEVSGTTYHFNSSGDHAGEWHGLPTTGEDFEFIGATEWTCHGLDFNCTWTWGAKIKKCMDSSGDWRIGLKVDSNNVSGGFACGTFALAGFPWYIKNSNSSNNHCPFQDSCDDFIPYDGNSSSYAAELGSIDLAIFGIPLVSDGYLQGVFFTPGTGANFAFNSDFYGCDGSEGDCFVQGLLTLTNATSLDIQ